MAPKRTVDQYLSLLMEKVSPLPPRSIASSEVEFLSHLAHNAIARLSLPRFSNSGVDGYAILAQDIHGSGPWTFLVGGDTPAGGAPVAINNGKAIRVMTGGPVPTTDRDLIVVPVELTNAPADHSLPETITINALPEKGNIRVRGEHVQPGDIAIPAGTALDAGAVATLISAGIDEVSAHPVPRVAVVTTGDEIDPDNPWGIPNSNGPMLVAELQRLGVHQARHIHSSDDDATLAATLDQVSQDVDLIITVGGISAGAFDVVKSLGVTHGGFDFFPVALRPGKPQGHGTWNGTHVLCLPGNPVAAWVSFQLFVMPVIRRMAGARKVASISNLPGVMLRSNRAVVAREGTAQALVVRIDWANQTAESWAHRSHMVGALAGSDGVIVVGDESVAEGDLVRVIVGRV
ncbi:molybdopterin biosynthesis protein [Corynebacterium deserti GIMN1.010]|uniref:Molybdopterin molybdenumtransferase n=1 Tax=Corynebacterium deserti GIMN1.010 TaxID=931089 RepID=A0A0M4CXE8_9CORY|nr:molybdopterin molybdotransferase MoeA [Corynebacterium deserti]ALC05595.1 molybdopterin biosynthesis protein [Corynebacterium deserti GIMN1.010]